jgi:hypothetical protein
MNALEMKRAEIMGDGSRERAGQGVRKKRYGGLEQGGAPGSDERLKHPHCLLQQASKGSWVHPQLPERPNPPRGSSSNSSSLDGLLRAFQRRSKAQDGIQGSKTG